MKTTLIVLTLLAGITTATAQSATTDKSFRSDGKNPRDQKLVAPSTSDSQIRGKHVTYDGIAIQATMLRKPLQLLNPLSPQAHDSAANNAVRDPKDGRVVGFKLFAIKF